MHLITYGMVMDSLKGRGDDEVVGTANNTCYCPFASIAAAAVSSRYDLEIHPDLWSEGAYIATWYVNGRGFTQKLAQWVNRAITMVDNYDEYTGNSNTKITVKMFRQIVQDAYNNVPHAFPKRQPDYYDKQAVIEDFKRMMHRRIDGLTWDEVLDMGNEYNVTLSMAVEKPKEIA